MNGRIVRAVEADTTVTIAPARSTRAMNVLYMFLQVGVVLAFLLLWQFLSDTAIVDPFFISSPTLVIRKIWTWLVDGSIYNHLIVTLREALSGWVIGSFLGAVIGFILARVTFLERIFIPLFHLLNTLPRIALAPLFIFWFGIGEPSKVILVVTIIVFIMIFNTYGGVKTISPDLLTMARLFGKGEFATLKEVIFPWCVPWIFIGLRLGLAWSLSGAVVGEFIAARAGIGYLIFNAASNLDNAAVLAGCVVLLAIAMIFFLAVSVLETWLLRWRPQHY